MPLTPEQEAIVSTALADAKQRKEAAGMDGAHHDGGYQRIVELIMAWTDGLEGRVPDLLKCYQEQARKQADPEWSEYQRLKRKFG